MLVPAAFTKVTGEAHWEVLLRARAIETQCYVYIIPSSPISCIFLSFSVAVFRTHKSFSLLCISANKFFDFGPGYSRCTGWET